MSARQVLLRLAGREYLPLAGWVLCWVMVALVAEPANAARLLAATMFVRGARALTTLDTGTAMRRRYGAPPAMFQQALSLCARIELLSLLSGAAVLAGIVLTLYALGQERAAWMTALVGIGLPARYFNPANGGRRRGGVFRLALAWYGLALIVAAELGDTGLIGIALAMGLREWLALSTVLAPVLRPTTPPAVTPVPQPLSWREVAATTVRRAGHRLNYRVGKGMLAAVLGPFGGIVARTGRGVGMHKRFDRFTPKTPLPMGAVAVAGAGGAAILLHLIPEPVTLIVAASMFRISAAAGNVLLWWRYADAAPPDDDEDDDED